MAHERAARLKDPAPTIELMAAPEPQRDVGPGALDPCKRAVSACRPVAVLDERERTGGLIARDQAADAKRTQPALATLASLQHLRLNGHRGLLIEIRRARYAVEFRDPETQRLRPAETRDDRRDGLEDRVRHDEVGQTEARTAFEHLISDPGHVADEYRWHREHVLGRHARPAS